MNDRPGNMARAAAALLLALMPTWAAGAAPPAPAPDLELFEPGVREAMADAIAAFEANFDGAADDAGRAAAWGRLGMIFQAHHLQDAARRCYEAATALEPGEFRWQYYLGYLYQETGEYGSAEQRLARALAIDPAYLPARLRIGQVRLSMQRLDAATEDFARVLDVEPSNAAALAGMGRAALQARDYEAAVNHLQAALRADPAADRLYHPLAMAYRQTGQVDRARASLARHGRTDPVVADPMLADMARLSRSSQMYLEQGYAAARAGRLPEAIEAFRTAVGYSPGDVTARVSLGQGLALAGDEAGALEQFDTALEMESGHPVARYRRGVILEGRGDDAGAVGDYRAALEGDPGYLQAQIRLGDALMRLDRFAEAAEVYASIEASGDGRGLFAYRAGLALLADGLCADAMAALESARALKPDSGEIFQALARTWASCPQASREQRLEGLDLAERLFRARPDQAHAETLAMAAAAAGDPSKAVEFQARLVEFAESRDGPFLDWQRRQLSRYRAGEGPDSAWPAQHPVFRPARLGAGPEAPLGR